MRLIILLGCVIASATGCHATKHSTACSTKPGTCPVPPGAPSPVTRPAVLPPTIREVRGPVAEDASDARSHAASANPHHDVLLIPRWVYVPYSPHVPMGQMNLPGGATGTTVGPYIQADERVTVLPPMSGAPMANSNETLEQCLQQMKLLNARIGDLEAKTAGRPALVAPQLLPIPPVPALGTSRSK